MRARRGATDLTQSATLTASDKTTSDQFGTSVAVNGDAVVVGHPGRSGRDLEAGAAYLFVKPGGGWAGPHRIGQPDRLRQDDV